MKTKDKISLIYKAATLIVLFIGLLLNYLMEPSGKMYLYFTIISNLSCFIFYLVAFILKFTGKLKKNELYYILKGFVTSAIVFTLVGFWIMYFTGAEMTLYKDHMTACRFVHLYAPLMVLFDYIIFAEKGKLKLSYAFLWATSCVIYGMVITIYILLGGTFLGGEKYPYFIMDVDKLGFFKVVITSLCMYLFYVGTSILVQRIDNKLKKEKKKFDNNFNE